MLNIGEPTSFRFGIDFLPNWFKSKLEKKEIDYNYDIWGDIIGCRFYSSNGKEIEINKGNKINIYMMYCDKEINAMQRSE